MKLTEKYSIEQIKEIKHSLLSKSDKFCNVCGTSETKQWYADPVAFGFMCKTHNRAWVYQLNNETENALSASYYEENKGAVIDRIVKLKKSKKEGGS